MDENPYRSPREQGYSPPRPGLDAKNKDTIALWITGAIAFALILTATLFVQWLLGNFPAR